MTLHSFFVTAGSQATQLVVMQVTDRLLYTQCWVVLTLYVFTTLGVFYRRSCIGCSAAFLLACILWIDLTVFNLWFFVPAFTFHLRLVDLQSGDKVSLLQALFTSEAAEDVGLMLLGWLGSCLSVSNAASIMQSEGCDAIEPHTHGKYASYFINFVYRVCDYAGLEHTNKLCSYANESTCRSTGYKSFLFAIPRWVHSYVAQTSAISPRWRLHAENSAGEKAELAG